MGPIRDQDTMGWCYAFAAADLLSFKLGQRISAASLAIQSNADSMPSWIRIPFTGGVESKMNGGNTANTISNGLGNRWLGAGEGLCLEKDFPRNILAMGSCPPRI